MRQFAAVLSTAASLAVTAQGFGRSDYSTDWDNAVPECWFDSPVECDFEGPCGEGAACFAGVCFPVRRYHCSDECPEGESLHPLRSCECMPDADVEAMFCQSEETDESAEGSMDESDGLGA